jgi:hypothetical protein
MPDTTVQLPSGATADLSKTLFGVIHSVDGSADGYNAAWTFGKALTAVQRLDEVEAYGTKWVVTEADESEYRSFGEESPQMGDCSDCTGTGHDEIPQTEWTWRPVLSANFCSTCWGRGEVNVSNWLTWEHVKCVGLLTFDGLLEFWNDEGYIRGTVNTMGALGTMTPDGMTFGWMPAFALESDGEEIQSAYVTPYPHDAAGEPIAELTEADFDAIVDALPGYREALEEERVARIRARKG